MSQALGSVHVLVWLASAYALLLLAVAYGFDKAARLLVGRAVIGHGPPADDRLADDELADHEPAVRGPQQPEPAGHDVWPATEAERFHRGIACAVVVVALLWPTLMLVTARSVTEFAILLATIAFVGLASRPLWRHLRRTPASFPVASSRGTSDILKG